MKAERGEILKHGLIAGATGYAITVAFFGVWNLLEGRSPFHTAALLGRVIFFGGIADGADAGAAPVFAFNGLHLLVFIAAGMVASWLASFSERGPSYWYLGISLFIYGVIHALGFVMWLTEPVERAVPAWAAVFATVLAVVAMSAYLFVAHPLLRRQMRENHGGE